MAYSPSFSIHHEARGFACQRRVGVEGACLAESDRHNILHDVLDGGLPLGRIRADREQPLNPWLFKLKFLVPV